jgi:hypothetical protein
MFATQIIIAYQKKLNGQAEPFAKYVKNVYFKNYYKRVKNLRSEI